MATIKNIITVGGGAIGGNLGAVAVTGGLESAGVERPTARTIAPALVGIGGMVLLADGFFRPRSSFASEKVGLGGGTVIGAALLTIRL